MRQLSRLTICHPLIQWLHHYWVMLRIMLTHLFSLHILPTSLHSIFTQCWLWVPQVPICILFHDLRLHTQLFLWMMLSCVLLFQTLHLLWMRNKPLTELELHNQHALSFTKSMSGSLSINTRWRKTPFHPRPLHSFLTSLVNLPSIILHVCIHPQMHPLLITRRAHGCWSIIRQQRGWLIHRKSTWSFICLFRKHRGRVCSLFIYPFIWFILLWWC